MKTLVVLFALIPALCFGAQTYCGKVEKLYFESPDFEENGERYLAHTLTFDRKQTIRYETFIDGESLTAEVKTAQIIPSYDEAGEINFELLEKLVGKSVCVSANAVASHTAHHIPPVILWSPKLISKK